MGVHLTFRGVSSEAKGVIAPLAIRNIFYNKNIKYYFLLLNRFTEVSNIVRIGQELNSLLKSFQFPSYLEAKTQP